MLAQKINELIAESMKSGQHERTEVLRAIKNEFLKYNTSGTTKKLDETIEIQLLNKMVKSRKDSIEQYKQCDRNDLAEKEEVEITIIKEFLPEEVSKEEIEKKAKEIITDQDKKKMGQYIKELKTLFPTADGKMIADIVKLNLN